MRKTMAIAGAALTLAGSGTVTATSASDKDPVAAETHFVPMDAISVPIIDGNRLEGSLRVKTVLDATDEAAAVRLKAALPRLRSATLAAALEFSRLQVSPMRAVDAELLSAALTKALSQEAPGISRTLVIEVAAVSA